MPSITDFFLRHHQHYDIKKEVDPKNQPPSILLSY